MGMFKQFKDAKKAMEAAPDMIQQGMQMGAQAQEMAAAQQAAALQQQQAFAAQQAAATTAGGASGPDFEPIAGVSLEQFAEVCRELASHGYDQSKAAGIAADKGIDGASWQQALDGWNDRVKANPAVAQQFNAHYRSAS